MNLFHSIIIQILRLSTYQCKDNTKLIMIETVVLIENGKYPFGELKVGKRTIKVQDIRVYRSFQELKLQKNKVQSIYLYSPKDYASQTTACSHENINIIKLLKIYQQDLFLHFIYEYVPYSLKQYIQTKLYQNVQVDKSSIMEMSSKLFLKKVCYQLGIIINFLVKSHIKTDLGYNLLGIDNDQNLKLFLDPSCKIIESFKGIYESANRKAEIERIQADLKEFYQWKMEETLSRIEVEFRRLKKKEHYVPNFIIKGNQLVFCQDDTLDDIDSPNSSNLAGSLSTDRCQSISEENLYHNQDQLLRGSSGNLFGRLKKTQSYNNPSQQKPIKKSNKQKIQQNINKLEHLRKKSKKLNDDVYNSYLSNSRKSRDPQKQFGRNSREFRPNSNQASKLFNKKPSKDLDEQAWRSSDLPKHLRQTHLPKGSTGKSPTKFSSNYNGNKRSHSTKSHKNSFQFNSKKEANHFNMNRSFDEGQQQQQNDKSFHKTTKSIRIELQQTTNKNKQRKNSYKVKILTCQQMEMDGQNIQEFMFNTLNKNFDQQGTHAQGSDNENKADQQFVNSQHGFDQNYQSKQRQNQREEIPFFQEKQYCFTPNPRNFNGGFSNNQQYEYDACRSQSRHSNRSNQNKFNEKTNIFADRFSSNQYQEQQVIRNYPKFSESPLKSEKAKIKQRQSTSQQKNIYQKYNDHFGKEQKKTQKGLKNQQLQEKIKLAKQKAQSVLNKYMKNKKYNNNKKSGSKIGY